MNVDLRFDRVVGWMGVVARAAIIFFCLAPVALILWMSLHSDVFVRFPPRELSLRLFWDLLGSEKWQQASLFSLMLCVPSALLTLLIVIPAVLALERGRVPGKSMFEIFALAPLLIPSTAFAISLYLLFLQVRLVGNFWALVAVEALNAIPASFIVIRAAVRRVDAHLEKASMSLGATRLQAIRDVTLPLIWPAIAVAFIFSFLVAFDDALYITFLGGRLPENISSEILSSLRFHIDALIAPLSTVLILIVTIPIAIASGLGRRQ